jgi:hypothetical protein
MPICQLEYLSIFYFTHAALVYMKRRLSYRALTLQV